MPIAANGQQHSYSLITGDDRPGSPQVIKLEGSDPQIALDFVQRQLPGREIELFEDGRRIGTVKFTRDGYWLILPRHALMRGNEAPAA